MTTPNWFLALPLPLGSGWDQAAATAPAGVRRFIAEDLHITVAFLGACGADAAQAAWQALQPLTVDTTRISAAGWRELGQPDHPSAYGLSLGEGHDAICDLLLQWGARALAAAGRPQERRPPLPHVTLLRPRRRDALRLAPAMQQWMAQAPLPAGTPLLTELALYTWTDDRSRQLFQVVQRRPLRG